ncbi:MAG: ABC transporter ATP-binding protein [Desulfobacteraceae bacterium]|nr:ABC transporter ATP-binding protein [Desulfobacteraceae bacterium]
MTPSIDIRNLTIRYNHTPVVDDLSFRINAGEFFIIIGPNGSGKTTLLKAVAGMIPHDHGTILLNDRSLHRYRRKELAASIAYVPQNLPLEFPFTVGEVVLMGRSPHQGILGMEGEADRRIAREAMEITETLHLAARKIEQLSGGERQRVFIARAISQDTPIILLDEPTAALDLAHQIQMMDLMERLKAEKQTTIVMVSHDINLAAMYGERLLMMKGGKVVTTGTPAEVLTFENLEAGYDCVVLVDQSPMGDFPRVSPVPNRYLYLMPRKTK